MKLPKHRTSALLVIAVLLAAVTMGNLTWCDVIVHGPPSDADTVRVVLNPGEVARDIRVGFTETLYRFALCPPGAITGVYSRTRRALDSFVTIDLVTSTNTPPGHYFLTYVEAYEFFRFEPELYRGVIDLTVEAPEATVTACMAVFGQNEVIVVNQPVSFYGCCSTSPEEDPIVQYKWWFNYNGNPSSSPSATTTSCMTTHTYTSAGTRETRLVVRTQSGEEAEDTQTIQVLSR